MEETSPEEGGVLYIKAEERLCHRQRDISSLIMQLSNYCGGKQFYFGVLLTLS